MIIKTDTLIKDLDNKPIKYDESRELSVGLVLANVMSTATSDPLRAYLLSKKLAEATEQVEIEKADYTFLKDNLTETKMYFALVKGQVLEILTTAYEAEEAKKKTTPKAE